MKAKQQATPYRKTVRRNRGSVLIGAVIVSTILAIAASGYLTYLNHEHYMNYRSMHWTQALYLMEAGVEDGFYELNFRYTKGQGFSLTNGWKAVGGSLGSLVPLLAGDTGYSKRVVGLRVTDFTGADGEVVGDYTVQVVNPGSKNPYIIATGVVTNTPYGTRVTRMVKVTTYERARFGFAIFADKSIDLNGNNITTDSYDSSDPAYSTNGTYDPAKARRNGDVATNQSVANSINVGNATIYGSASTGPGGSVAIGPQGTVTGEIRRDVRADLPPAELPKDFNLFTAVPLGNVTNSATLVTGDYVATSISLNGSSALSFAGKVRLYVTGDITVGGTSGRLTTVDSSSSVEIYANGSSMDVKGIGIVNASSAPKNFQIYGLPGLTSMSLGGNAAMSAAIYSPNADLSMNGGGNNVTDVTGSVVVKSLKMSGHFKIHFDEALLTPPPAIGYRAKSWKEIPVAQ